MKRILLIGGGGHCRSVLDCVLAADEYDEIGIVDRETRLKADGAVYAGRDEDLPDLLKNGWDYAFITVGSIGNTALRRKLYAMINELGFKDAAIIDPTAVIARGVNVGPGTFIGKRSIVNAGSVIGSCSIVNSGAVIEHDCSLGDFVHVSPGAVLCGNVTVGDDSHIGAGSVIRQGITIGKSAVIGAGSVVVKDIPDNAKAYGNPCRVIEK